MGRAGLKLPDTHDFVMQKLISQNRLLYALRVVDFQTYIQLREYRLPVIRVLNTVYLKIGRQAIIP